MLFLPKACDWLTVLMILSLGLLFPICAFGFGFWLGLYPTCSVSSVSFIKCTHQKRRLLICLRKGSLSSLQWSRQLAHVFWRPSQNLCRLPGET